MSWVRNLKKNLLILFLGILVAFILAEAIIRLFPERFLYWRIDNVDTIVYKKHKELGYICAPNQKGFYARKSHIIYPIGINSFGFRDNEWDTKADFKIAILGDSLMQAIQVSDSDCTSAILDKLLNKEVLNAGVGGFGTVAETVVYKIFLKSLKPDIVIVFFEPNTDISDNSCELFKLISPSIIKPCAYILDGKMKLESNFVFVMDLYPRSLIKENIRKYCFSCAVVYRFIYDMILYRILYPSNKVLGLYGVFLTSEPKEWQDAWGITEKVFVDLKHEVETNGGRLLIVFDTVSIMYSKNWKEEVRRITGVSKLPEDFDPFYPVKRLKEISQRNKILFLELLPYFLEYRDKFNLRSPYFSYYDDGHWNPVGHFLAANLVAKYLIENSLIPLSEGERQGLLKKIERNIKLSPLQILGEEAYKQIYNRGVYRGFSNIRRILERE